MQDLKIFTQNIEEAAIEQINLLLRQEAFKSCKVRIMPDVHSGKGCVIGFTADLVNKVIPNIVGVDIGCGMLCVELGKIDVDLANIDRIINRFIPAGRNIREHKLTSFEKINDLYCLRELKDRKKFEKSIGTLGGGNHFIEIDKDAEDNKYLVIHTGSRNLGKQIAEYYQNLAIKLCSPKLPRDLCYLEGKYRDKYLHDMKICQQYASLNRKQIANEILKQTSYWKENKQFACFETIHNYISFDDNIVRKGAISAKKDEKVLIPINMRDGAIIAIGKGNKDWNESAPHGAGRIMSRKKAKETFKLEDFRESMKDVYTTSVVKETIDEAPFVYKPIQEILENIRDTVEVERIIKPIYNFKAKN